MKTLLLSPNKDYDKLYYFLKDKGFSEALISTLRKLPNSLTIDGTPANMRSKLKKGDKLKVTFFENASSQIKPIQFALDILYEDEDLLIINKPASMPSIPSKRHFENNIASAVMFYMQKYNQPFVYRVLGRLDKETSGVLIIAKNQFSASMTSHKKTYLALCHGTFTKQEFEIDKPIATLINNQINQQKREISQDGKNAQTHVKVLKSLNNISLLEISLQQGRTHQIRVHLSSIGHPLLGDKLYGKEEDLAPRVMLHCASAIVHPPLNGLPITVTAPLPDDFNAILNHQPNKELPEEK